MKESEKVFPLNPKPKEASKATYAGDYGVKKSLVDTMLKSTPVENKGMSRRCMEAQVKLDVRLGINMDSYTDLKNINLLHTHVNNHTLDITTIEAVIAKMRKNFLKLHQKFKMSETLKLHVIFSHYLEYFQLTGHTLLKYTDEVTEAVHSQLRMFEERHQYKRNNKESDGHAKAQHNCIVFFNSVALGDL